MYRLLSDRSLCWKEPILVSYPFLGYYVHKRSPKAAHSISGRPSREAENPSSKWPGGHKSITESKHIYCSFISIHSKLNSIFSVKPTLSRSLPQKFLVYTFLTARVHSHPDTRPLNTGMITLPYLQIVPCREPHRHLAPMVLKKFVDDWWQWGEAQIEKKAGLENWKFLKQNAV